MAVKDLGGRMRSERSPEEVQKLILEQWATLSEEEREAVRLCMEEFNDPAFTQMEEPPTRIYDVIRDGEYLHEPVDIETFVMDPYYLGNTCDMLYPRLLGDMKELFSGGYGEAILSGSIGWGKTFFASIAFCRILYELSCMRNPQRSFGISPSSDISFVVLSVKEDLAIKVAFENIISKIKESPYFKENFPFNPMKKEIKFPNNIQVAARASTDSAALGLNVYAAFIDEGNFMPDRKNKDPTAKRVGGLNQAQFLYNQLIRRMKSRFMRSGRLPGMMIVVSSKQTKDDFTAKRVRESKDDPSVFVRDYATWHVKPDAFTGGWFKVLVGNAKVPSKILTDEEHEVMKGNLQDGLVIVDVPEDYREDFENDLENAIRDVAGIETVSVSPFMQRREMIQTCIDSNRSHPFSVESWVQTEGGTINWTKLARQVEERDGAMVSLEWQPIFYPGVPRHVHIDVSKNTDFTGIAVGCVIGHRTVVRRDEETKEQFREQAPVIWVDFVLQVIPPVGGEIDLGKIRGLVYQFQRHGFLISMASMDQWNSMDTLQKLAKKGVKTEVVSVDKPMDAYDTLKAAIYENRVSYYSYDPLLKELREVQRDVVKGKVDHPKEGSKDCADALAGIVFTLSTNYSGPPMGIVKGVSSYSDPSVNEQVVMVSKEGDDVDDEDLPPFIMG